MFWAKLNFAAQLACAIILAGVGFPKAMHLKAAEVQPAMPNADNSSKPAKPVDGKIVKDLQLVLSADKAQCPPGGPIVFTVTLVNRGKAPLKYLQYPDTCGPSLSITNQTGQPVKYEDDPSVPTRSIPAPDRQHVKELAAGGKWEHKLWVAWKIFEPAWEVKGLGGRVERMVPGCGWEITKPGKYAVVAHYGPDYAAILNEKYKLDIWDGQVESNALVIEVKLASDKQR